MQVNARPTYFQFRYADNGIDQTSVVHAEDVEAGLWEIGVYGYIGGDYNITITVSDRKSLPLSPLYPQSSPVKSVLESVLCF